jgi:putative tricarboxylic transport membrane protein
MWIGTRRWPPKGGIMDFTKRSTFGSAVIGIAAMALFSLVTSTQAWEPKKPIDFVIMAGKGGGADKMARLMQNIVEKHDLSSKPLIPVNKPGGSGAEALIHLKGKHGDDHTIMVTLNSFYTTPLRNPKLGVDIATFTPIARMAEDTFVLWVHKESGIKDLDGFVNAAREKGRDFQMAGTGKGQEDEILVNFLNTTYDLTIKYIPFKGGGAVAKQLAGQHVDATVNNPSEALGFYQSGLFVPIAAFTAARLDLFPETPTFEELGKDFSYYMQRSVVGAPGMSPEAEAFYRELFRKVFDSAEWQEYRKTKALYGDFLTGEALKEYWAVQKANHERLLRDAGELK